MSHKLRMLPSHRPSVFCTFVVLVLLVGACGKGDGGTDTGTTPSTPTGTTPSTSTGTSTSSAAVEITGNHSVAIGQQLPLSATTQGATDSSYAWSSDDPSVATVDSAGMVTGVAVGETEVQAAGADSGASARHVVVVTATPADPVVMLEGLPVVQVGDSAAFTASTLNGVDGSYTWSSSDPVIASVDGSGVVVGNAAGEVSITATGDDSGSSALLQLAVIEPVPHYNEWLASGHADITAEAFTHWNTAVPPEVPETCARCHGTPGFLDYLGADGSAQDVVDQAHPVGSVVSCSACHDPAAEQLTHVIFPSGEVLEDLGPEARCMTCHQGRASGDDVDAAIATAAVGDDETSPSLAIDNIHYYAAGATVNATRVRGGYEYAGEVYEPRLRHVDGYDTCTGCHDPHTLEVRLVECQSCHPTAVTINDVRDLRMAGSEAVDYDGDGDRTEGTHYEVDGLKALLLSALQGYATEQSLAAICYSPTDYPYWFQDTDQSGDCSATEAVYPNQYASWTPRMMRAAYNYSVASNDPGSWVHNPRYTIQLLHDGIADLNTVLLTPVDLSAADRTGQGHFGATGATARGWIDHETPTAECSTCHGGSEGLDFYLTYGVGLAVPERDAGLDCAVCHVDPGTSTALRAVDEVSFPGGVTLSDPGNDGNLCVTCHQGRASGAQIDAAIAAGSFAYQDPHALTAGALKKGTLAQVGYEYAGKAYAGEWVFHGTCLFCHDATNADHSFAPADNPTCTGGCHSPTPIPEIRVLHTLDYDGDGSTTEPLADELQTLSATLLAEMNAVGGLCHDDTTYPHFFTDNDFDGVCDPGEAIAPNAFTGWSPSLLRAAHNYRLVHSDPGAWVHNFDYAAQLLYDSIEDLSGAGPVAGFIRP